jgi:hypothetical protein
MKVGTNFTPGSGGVHVQGVSLKAPKRPGEGLPRFTMGACINQRIIHDGLFDEGYQCPTFFETPTSLDVEPFQHLLPFVLAQLTPGGNHFHDHDLNPLVNTDFLTKLPIDNHPKRLYNTLEIRTLVR